MSGMKKIDPEMELELFILAEDHRRDPKKTAAGREAFLASADELRKVYEARKKLEPKHNRSSSKRHPALRPVFSLLLPIFLAVALVLGTGVVTVAASKNSQPNGMLYSIKLASEDIALELTSDPATKFEMASEFEQNRSSEIVLMLQDGEIPSEEVMVRYENQINRSIKSAIVLPDDAAINALSALQSALETQKNTIVDLLFTEPDSLFPHIQKYLIMVNDHVNVCIAGQKDLAWIRELYQKVDSSGGGLIETQPSSITTSDTTLTDTATSESSQPEDIETSLGDGDNQGGGIGNTKTHTPPAWGQGGKDTRTPTEGNTPEPTKTPPGQGKKDN